MPCWSGVLYVTKWCAHLEWNSCIFVIKSLANLAQADSSFNIIVLFQCNRKQRKWIISFTFTWTFVCVITTYIHMVLQFCRWESLGITKRDRQSPLTAGGYGLLTNYVLWWFARYFVIVVSDRLNLSHNVIIKYISIIYRIQCKQNFKLKIFLQHAMRK